MERTPPIQISFWQPVVRDRWQTQNPIIIVAEGIFDTIIDPLYTFPFYSSARHLHQLNRQILPFTFNVRQEDKPVSRMFQVSRLAVVIAGLYFYRRMTVVLLVADLAIKCLVRSKEHYTTPTGSRPLSPTQKDKNRQRWAQKWWCHTMFYLFAIGQDEKIAFPAESPEVEDSMISVMIGVDAQNYPRSFLESLPFFKALLSSTLCS